VEKRISINPEKYVLSERAEIRGVTVEVFVSPYDVPTDVVGDEVDGKFTIDFRYAVMDEPVEIGGKEGPLTFHVGKYSQRLQKIEVDSTRSRIGFVELRLHVEKGIDRLASVNRLERRQRSGNYRIAKEVIRERGMELLGV
jgi:hypothetical protein